jgi:subtilisin family serine protease
MRTTARIGVCLLAGVLTGAGLVPAAQAAEPQAPPTTVRPATTAAGPAPTADRTVTLITGDRLLVAADGRSATRLPSPGRDAVPLLSRIIDDRLQVVPTDALALLHANVLDRRLFDITRLLEYGYDDSRDDLPLIVSYTDDTTGRSALRAEAVAEDATVVRRLPAVDGSAITVDRDASAALWDSLTDGSTTTDRSLRPGYRKIWLDGISRPTLAVSVPQIGAPAAWAAGYTGAGVAVGVLDSGVDLSHPDVAEIVAESKNFGADADLTDRAGHGTHVAGIIAGSGAASGGTNKGVAPGARIYNGKVCEAYEVPGQATPQYGCPDSAVLAGMTWAAKDKHLKVVNMSLGGTDEPGIDVLEEAVNTLTAEYGTLFVIAAGNSRPPFFTPVSSPSTADAALAVAATDRGDNHAIFSNRGPRVGDLGLKPDIAAPGAGIVAPFSADTTTITSPPTGPGNRYVAYSGTSMAAPHVAGAAAILAQQHPDWTAADLKAALMSTAASRPGQQLDQVGAGRVDVAKAVASPVRPSTGSLYFGIHRGPHADDEVATKTVTYHNSGTAPLTLALTLDTTAPKNMFTTDVSSVTVPAGGAATVALTGDPRVQSPDGRFTGKLVATGPGVQVRTTFGVQKEPETYELTIHYRNRAGELTGNLDSGLYDLAGSGWRGVHAPDGTAVFRAPKGTYTLDAVILDEDGSSTQLVQPKLTLTQDTVVEMDARLGRPIAVTVPRPDARQFWAHVAFTFPTPYGSFLGYNLEGTTFDTMYAAQIGKDTDLDGFLADIAGSWAKIGPDGTERNSPYVYHLAWFSEDRFFTGFTKRVHPGAYATVQAEYAATTPGAFGARRTSFASPLDKARGWTTISRFDLPAKRTEYYSTDGAVRWSRQFDDGLPGAATASSISLGAPTVYLPGRVTGETWGQAVVSPAFVTSTAFPAAGVRRTGDTIAVAPSWFSDAAGHDSYVSGATPHLTVTRDGTVVEDRVDYNAQFATTGADAAYTITQSFVREPATRLSRRIETTWTFRSATTAADTPLPVSVVRFAPQVDGTNTTVPGPIEMLPVTVAHQPGSTAGVTTTLSVQVSFDGGTTWAATQVFGTGDRRQVLLKRPAGHGPVSLRAKASDAAGNTVEQTVINAYRY